MERERDEFVQLVSGALGAIWRARLELSLLALPIAAYLALDRVASRVGAICVVLMMLGAAAGVPAFRRWLREAVYAAHVRRRWRRAWIDAELPPSRALRVARVPAGDLVELRVARGSSVAETAERAEELAACLHLRDLRVSRDPADAARGWVTLVRRDPLVDLAGARWPHTRAAVLSLWDPIPLGVNEDGETVWLSLPERNLLLGGEPGAGKSAALALVIATAALDPTANLWLLDGKLVELAAWAPCARRAAGADVGEAIELLREVRGEMEARYRRLLADGRRKVARGDGPALHLVVVDELAFYLTVEDRKQRAEFSDLLRDLVARGRAAGVIVAAATQKPASDIVPTTLRDLFGLRLAMRCNTPQASDTILGQGWATLGYRASDIPAGQRGVGYLLAEDGTPVRLRTYYLADDEISDLAQRATALRLQEDWTRTALPSGDAL